MSIFERRLNAGLLTPKAMSASPRLCELLSRCEPAGSDGAGKPILLRLAVRKNYVNFYHLGQSIAKVEMGRKLSAKTHAKYLTDLKVEGEIYCKLADVDLKHPDHGGIDRWIARSEAYHGQEKSFIERIYGANGLLIDLEMALPGLRLAHPITGAARLIAPRIDLVGLEAAPEGGWSLVFWEAKRMQDKRLRKPQEEPEVLSQLRTYALWFARPSARVEVLTAYRNLCALLQRLQDLSAALGFSPAPLHPAIREIAADPSRLTGLDPQVRLLIDGRKNGAAFRSDHLPRFLEAGIPTHLVETQADLLLPHRSAMESAPLAKAES